MKSLIAVVADKSMKAVIDTVITRHQAIGIRDLSGAYTSHVLGNYDSEVFLSAQEFLRSFQKSHSHALVMCDRVGSGQTANREEMESQIEARLNSSGWQGRSSAVVIEPELDIWVWQRSLHLEEAIGWRGRSPNLYQWLENERWIASGETKPVEPKRALDQALWTARTPKSSRIFKDVASRVSLTACLDPAFVKLRNTLQSWFAA